MDDIQQDPEILDEEDTKKLRERKEKYGKYQRVIKAIGSEGVNTIPALTKVAYENDVIKKGSENEPPYVAMNKLLETFITEFWDEKVFLIFDDFDILLQEENKLFIEELKNLMTSSGVCSMIILHTENFQNLSRNQNEIVYKDAFCFEVLPLTIGELKDCIRRRLLYYSSESVRKFDHPPIPQELQPFSEDAVEYIANISKGNIGTFIEKLKEAIKFANDKHASSVSLELAKMSIDAAIRIPIDLSTTEKQVMEYIKERKGVTIQNVAYYLGKGRITAYFILKELLYSKGLLVKNRRKREMIYSLKV